MTDASHSSHNGTQLPESTDARRLDFLRKPPFDEEAERAALGAMLISQPAANEVLEILVPEDFYLEAHRTMYAAMQRIYDNSDGVIDRIMVRQELLKTTDLERVGGMRYLHELMEDVPLISNACAYAKIVRHAATKRRLLDAGSKIQDDATAPGSTPPEAMSRAQELLDHIDGSALNDDDEFVSLAQAIEDGVPLPEEFETSVLVRGAVHLVYGDSEAGKTWFVLWLIVRAISRGQRVLYYDAENGKRIVSERLRDLGLSNIGLGRSRLDCLLRYSPFPSLSLDSVDSARYKRRLDKLQPDLVIFDSLSNYLGQAGCDENIGSDIERWSSVYTREARRREITTVVLDHPGHDADRPRGSSRKKQEVDAMWRLTKTQQFGRDQVGEITLTRKKDRESWLPESVTFSAGGAPDRFVFVRSSGTVEERESPERLLHSESAVLDALRDFEEGGARTVEWQRAAAAEPYSVPRPTFYRAKSELVERCLVTEEDGVFGLADISKSGLTGGSNEGILQIPSDTSTTGSGITETETSDTSKNPINKPKTDAGLTRYHHGLIGEMRPPDPEVSQVSHPYRGDTVRPGPDTGKTEGSDDGLTPRERARRLRDRERAIEEGEPEGTA